MRKILILLVLCAALFIPVVSAATGSFYLLDQQGKIPSGLFMFILASAFVSLVASYRWNDELCGAIAIMTGFMAAWTSRGIDYVTGITIDSTSAITVIHTIYQPDIVTLMTIILFVVSILNEYRIYVLYQNARQDNQMGRVR